MKFRLALAVLAAVLSVSIDTAFAQFNQVIVFGDSNVDSGFYKALSSPGAGGGAGGTNYNLSWPAAVAHGAGAPTSNPTPMNVQILAAHFGLTANPANTSGGTNYATSGAKNVTINGGGNGGFTAAVPTVTQIQNYLNANSGAANPQALYVIWSGDNDVSLASGDSGSNIPADPNAYVVQAANDLAAKIVVLRNAGARYLMVSGLAYGFPVGDAPKRALKLTYTNTLWNALDSAGVSYKRSDIESVRQDIVTNRVSYGFDFIDTAPGHMACNPVVPNPNGSGTVTIGSAWSLLCSSDPQAPSQYLSPTAPQKMLFADDAHMATKGHQIVGNYLIQLASTIGTSGKAPHDFNGDGKSDILWRNTSGEAGMWLMNGGSIASAPSLGVVPNSWSVVGQRDFNGGDGKNDLLWRNTSGDTGIWFMNGGSTLSTAGIGNIPSNWSVVGTGDFDGDGKADILWRNTVGDVWIWFMNGGTALSIVPLGNVATTWSVMGTADFDGNGKADILWRNTAHDVGIWFMNGGTIASTSGLGNVGPTWSVAGTGDFDGNGKGDILWRSTSNDVGLWFMNGGILASTAGLGNVGASWQVASVGDYDGNGKADILWRSTSHDIGIWFMNGGALASTAGLGNVGPTWIVQNAASN